MAEKIQLYSLATPNGQKVGIALEEMGLPYDAHLINISKGDQFKPEFVKVNPNSKYRRWSTQQAQVVHCRFLNQARS